ncbi:hypothetical protein LCGC14_0856440 [marine sediment metagenome]|uniref:Phage-like element PBSX protein XkdF domain-containing protein n=1 Tax=marine sediment metagenome TaxID=412755 RepID=A0A0F9PDK4_9ZZZZ
MVLVSKGTTENRTMPDRNSAYSAVWDAVRSGKIKRGRCRVCGATKTQAHHPTGTYSGTKSITWLCDKHHRAAHVRKRSGKGYKKSEGIRIEVIKADDAQRLVYLVAVKPNTLDTDNQWFSLEDVELMAHRFLVRYGLGEAHLFEEHDKRLSGVYIAQSYVAPVDFVFNNRRIIEGTWMVVLYVPNDEVWEKIIKGELTGASPRGPAVLAPGVMPTLEQVHDSSTHGKDGVPVGM